MISGFKTLQHLDQGLDSVRKEVDQINKDLNAAN